MSPQLAYVPKNPNKRIHLWTLANLHNFIFCLKVDACLRPPACLAGFRIPGRTNETPSDLHGNIIDLEMHSKRNNKQKKKNKKTRSSIVLLLRPTPTPRGSPTVHAPLLGGRVLKVFWLGAVNSVLACMWLATNSARM